MGAVADPLTPELASIRRSAHALEAVAAKPAPPQTKKKLLDKLKRKLKLP